MATFTGECVVPYSFEPEYSDDKARSDSQPETESDSESSCELQSLDWCECENCDNAKLTYRRECVCCREIPVVRALLGIGLCDKDELNCVVHNYDFANVCLNRVVLRTVLLRLKHSSQGR